MPLPDAPDPDNTILYEQLRSKTLSDLTVEELDQFRSQFFVNGINEDDFRRLDLIFAAANKTSSSGGIPGTVDVVTFSTTSSGSAVALDQTGFWLEPGATYIVYAPSISVGGGSGSIQHELRLIRSGRTVELLDFSTTGGSLRPTTEEGFIGGEVRISYPAYLVYEATGTFTNSTMALAIVRER